MELRMGPDNSRQERLSDMIERHEKELLRMCCVYLGEIGMAEDAVQETFLKAYKKMDDFRGESSEKTWLFRIAINVCKDMRRGSWFRRIRQEVNLERLVMPIEQISVESLDVTEAILRLPEKYREVIYLYYYEGYKLREIADMLHSSVPSISRRIDKAKDALRNALEGGLER